MRRFIYNNDGTNILGSTPPGELSADAVRAFVDQLTDTPVTSFFICACAARMYYRSVHEGALGVLRDDQSPGDTTDAHPERYASYAGNMKRLLEEGTNIVELCVNRAREHGLEAFASMRMNDLHFNEPDIDLPQAQSDFWREHLDLTVGTGGNWHEAGALDFRHDAVRDYKLRLVREICESFDVDGIELDWLRFPTHFPPGTGREHVDVLTGFMAAARDITREVGDARGRPVLLAARVPPLVDNALDLGFDPVEWARRDLVDFLTASCFFTNDPLMPLADLGTAVDGRVPVYGSIDSGVHSPRQQMTHGRYRAMAAWLHDQGADGIYLFNHFFNLSSGAPEGDVDHRHCVDMIGDLASIDSLVGRNALCTLPVTTHDYHVAHTHMLPAGLTGGATLTFPLPSHLRHQRPRRGWLVMRYRGAQPTGVTWNDAAPAAVDDADAVAARFALTGNRGDDDAFAAFVLNPGAILPGDNRLATTGGGELHRADVALEFGPVQTHGWF